MLLQVGLVGRERLVLDLSCRKRDGRYYVVTDRWQRFSELEVNEGTLADLGARHLHLPLFCPALLMCLARSNLCACICTVGMWDGSIKLCPSKKICAAISRRSKRYACAASAP